MVSFAPVPEIVCRPFEEGAGKDGVGKKSIINTILLLSVQETILPPFRTSPEFLGSS